MRTDRVSCLVEEYWSVRKALREYEIEYEKAKVFSEIRKDLIREFELEKQQAVRLNDKNKENYWQSVHDDLFTKDERVCDMAELENAKKTVDKNERIIAYYKKKLKIISKLLGDRIMTILEGYEQRNILLGGGISSDTLTNIIDEEEEETVSDKAKKDNQGYTFGKM